MPQSAEGGSLWYGLDGGEDRCDRLDRVFHHCECLGAALVGRTGVLLLLNTTIEVGKRSYCVLFTVVFKFMRTNMLVLVYVIVVVTSYLSARLQTRVSSAVWVISPPVLYVYPVICMWE